MSYIPPGDVTSPKTALQLVKVLFDGGPWQEAYAMGFWGKGKEKHRVCLFRWNGGEDAPLGNPQSRGLPIWVVLGERVISAVVESLEDPDAEAHARAFFDMEEE